MRAVLDYGCIAYTSAKTNLKKLDVEQAQVSGFVVEHLKHHHYLQCKLKWGKCCYELGGSNLSWHIRLVCKDTVDHTLLRLFYRSAVSIICPGFAALGGQGMLKHKTLAYAI